MLNPVNGLEYQGGGALRIRGRASDCSFPWRYSPSDMGTSLVVHVNATLAGFAYLLLILELASTWASLRLPFLPFLAPDPNVPFKSIGYSLRTCATKSSQIRIKDMVVAPEGVSGSTELLRIYKIFRVSLLIFYVF